VPVPDNKQHVECCCPECEDSPLLDSLEGDLLVLYAAYIGDGHWTLTRPTLPGIYGIASLEGDHVGYREFKMRDGECVDTLQAHGEPGWCGYFYSHPLPPPPREIPN